MPERGASPETSGPQTRASRARQGAAAVAIAICIGIAIYVYSRVGFDLDPRSVRDRIAEFGILAPAIYVGVATLRIFLEDEEREMRATLSRCEEAIARLAS